MFTRAPDEAVANTFVLVPGDASSIILSKVMVWVASVLLPEEEPELATEIVNVAVPDPAELVAVTV